jgi:hypothetical protein
MGVVWKIQHSHNRDGMTLSLYPNGKNFAFTITDDPDGNTLEKIKPVYDYLRQTRIKSTAAVWVFKGNRSNGIPDAPRNSWSVDTCEKKDYLAYMQQLRKEGFEIALHGVSPGNDRRDRTIRGYEKFRDYFGTYPKMNIMHAQNLENVYWGKKVVSNSTAQFLIGLFINKSKIPFSGNDPSSQYFWGDILQKKTKYTRLFGTSDINTLRFNPSMPYHDTEKPFVNYWFSFSDGFNVNGFNNLILKQNVDKLVSERGACIVYTHFAHGFALNGKLNQTFQDRISYLVSQPDGWFVPASDVLDRLLLMKNVLLNKGKDCFMVLNLNEIAIEGVTILVPSDHVRYGLDGRKYDVNAEGEIILETIEANSAVVLFDNKEQMLKKQLQETLTDSTITVIDFEDAIFLARKNGGKLEKLPSQLIPDQTLFNLAGQEILLNKGGQIQESTFAGKKVIVLLKNKRVLHPKKQWPTKWEYLNMVFRRAILFLKHNKNFRAQTK